MWGLLDQDSLVRTEPSLSSILIKKKSKFSSYIRKFRMGQSQSHILMASSYMVKYLRIFSYIRKPFLGYDFATAPFWISLYMRKNLIFFFISAVHSTNTGIYKILSFCVRFNPPPWWRLWRGPAARRTSSASPAAARNASTPSTRPYNRRGSSSVWTRSAPMPPARRGRNSQVQDLLPDFK